MNERRKIERRNKMSKINRKVVEPRMVIDRRNFSPFQTLEFMFVHFVTFERGTNEANKASLAPSSIFMDH